MNKLQIFFVYYIVIIAFYCPAMMAMDCSMIGFGSDQKNDVVDWTSRSTILPPVLTTNTGDFSQSMVGGKPWDSSATVIFPNTNKSLAVEKTATEKKEEELFAWNASFFVSSVNLLLQSYQQPIPVGLQFTQQLVERKVRSRGYVLELLKNIPNVIKTEDTKNFLNSIAEHLRSMQKPVNKELVGEWTKKIDAMREACEFVEEVDAVAKEPKIIGEKNNKALGFCLKKIKSKEELKRDLEQEWSAKLLQVEKKQQVMVLHKVIRLNKEEKNCIEKQRKVRRREFKLKKILKEQKQNVLTLEKEKNKFGFFVAYAFYLDNLKNNYLPMIKKKGRSTERTLSTIEDAQEILYTRALDILNENQINKAPESMLVPVSNPASDDNFANNADCANANMKYKFDENAEQWIVALEFIVKEIEGKPQNALLIEKLQKFDPKNNLDNLQEWSVVYAEKVRHYLSLCNKLVQYNKNFTLITEKMQQEREALRSKIDDVISSTSYIVKQAAEELRFQIAETFFRPIDAKEIVDLETRLNNYIASEILILHNKIATFDPTQNNSAALKLIEELGRAVEFYSTHDETLKDKYQTIKNAYENFVTSVSKNQQEVMEAFKSNLEKQREIITQLFNSADVLSSAIPTRLNSADKEQLCNYARKLLSNEEARAFKIKMENLGYKEPYFDLDTIIAREQEIAQIKFDVFEKRVKYKDDVDAYIKFLTAPKNNTEDNTSIEGLIERAKRSINSATLDLFTMSVAYLRESCLFFDATNEKSYQFLAINYVARNIKDNEKLQEQFKSFVPHQNVIESYSKDNLKILQDLARYNDNFAPLSSEDLKKREELRKKIDGQAIHITEQDFKNLELEAKTIFSRQMDKAECDSLQNKFIVSDAAQRIHDTFVKEANVIAALRDLAKITEGLSQNDIANKSFDLFKKLEEYRDALDKYLNILILKNDAKSSMVIEDAIKQTQPVLDGIIQELCAKSLTYLQEGGAFVSSNNISTQELYAINCINAYIEKDGNLQKRFKNCVAHTGLIERFSNICSDKLEKLAMYNDNFAPLSTDELDARVRLRSTVDSYCSGTMDIIQEKYAELLLDINKTFSRPMDKKEAGDFIGKLTAYIAERIYALKNQMRNFDITQNVSGKISVLHSLEKQVLVYGTYDAQLNDAFQRIKNKCIHCALDCIKQSFIEKDQDAYPYTRIPGYGFVLTGKDPSVTYRLEGEKFVRVVPEKEQEWRDALLFIGEELAQKPRNTMLIEALKAINLKDASIIKDNIYALADFPVVDDCLKTFFRLTKYSSELCFLVTQSVLVNQAIDILNSLQDREIKSEKELHQYGLALKMVAYEIINNKNTPFKDQINKLRVKIDLKGAIKELQNACEIIEGFKEAQKKREESASQVGVNQTVRDQPEQNVGTGNLHDDNATSELTSSVPTPSSWNWLSWLNPFAWLFRKA